MRRRKPEPGAAAEADQRTVQTAAYALLAGRDFSRHELTERLLRKGYGAAVVEAAVAAIVQEGFLREERFAEQFVTQRAGRGQGPLRVRMGLRDKRRRVRNDRPGARHDGDGLDPGGPRSPPPQVRVVASSRLP